MNQDISGVARALAVASALHGRPYIMRPDADCCNQAFTLRTLVPAVVGVIAIFHQLARLPLLIATRTEARLGLADDDFR